MHNYTSSATQNVYTLFFQQIDFFILVIDSGLILIVCINYVFQVLFLQALEL